MFGILTRATPPLNWDIPALPLDMTWLTSPDLHNIDIKPRFENQILKFKLFFLESLIYWATYVLRGIFGILLKLPCINCYYIISNNRYLVCLILARAELDG